MVNYKITKVLHAKLNFYKYIKVYIIVYYINTLIPFLFWVKYLHKLHKVES